MPRVEAYVYAMLRRYQPDLSHGQPAILDLPEGATIDDLLVALGIPAEETKKTFVNGLSRGLDWELSDGDRVAVFPPIAGGTM
jgi:molybdopterin synthase sulfur carrier subunit